jgi:hypothetical protein
VGERFTSFDDAWEHFLRRAESLESFYATLPDDAEATIDRWVVRPPDQVKDAAVRLQRSFAALSWIAPLPRHFLHVTLNGRRGGEGEREPELDWSSVPPFEAEFGPVSCFPVAVVAEVRAPALEERIDAPLFLPHLSLGYFREAGEPKALRRALEPLRGAELGTAVVREVSLVRIPVAKSRLLEPWTVLRTVGLEPTR